MTDPIITGAAASAATGLAKPIYEDALQPATREVGKALATVAKTIHVALAPVSALVWGYEKIGDHLQARLTAKLAGTPPDQIVTPPANVAGPAIEAMRFTGEIAELRELYAALLASAMDSRTSNSAHPAFVEIIRQLTSDEAQILKHFEDGHSEPLIEIRSRFKDGSGFTVVGRRVCNIDDDVTLAQPTLVQSYLDNLERLGLVEMPRGHFISTPGAYDRIESEESVKRLRARIDQSDGQESQIDRCFVSLTSLGILFVQACVRARPGELPKNGA
jgi:hypothetical protein